MLEGGPGNLKGRTILELPPKPYAGLPMSISRSPENLECRAVDFCHILCAYQNGIALLNGVMFRTARRGYTKLNIYQGLQNQGALCIRMKANVGYWTVIWRLTRSDVKPHGQSMRGHLG
jgi:hypothetical protein